MHIQKFRHDVIQFIKFSIVGVSNTAISLIIYYLFLLIDQKLYMVGNVVGWIVSVANSFFWNNRFVFRSADHGFAATVRKLLRTYITYGATFLLTSILLYLEIDILHLSVFWCPLCNLLITIPLNFLMNKYWTFHKKQTGGSI